MAANMFQNMNIALGVQVEFYYHWIKNETRQTVQVNALDQAEQSSSSHQQSNDAAHNHTFATAHQCVIEAPRAQSSEFLSLHDILTQGPYGPGVLAYYKDNDKLNDKARKLLVEAFLHHCLTYGISASKADCKSVASQIAHTFKGEITVKELFFITVYMMCLSSLCCPVNCIFIYVCIRIMRAFSLFSNTFELFWCGNM